MSLPSAFGVADVAVAAPRKPERRAGFAGLRLSADEYFALPYDQNRYELIDGVVHMSASPTPMHQLVALRIVRPLADFVDAHGLGLVLYETDVSFGPGVTGRDLVYRPEIIFFSNAKAAQIRKRIKVVPDVLVEVVSPDSRSLDLETKFNDYERAGVLEYWLIDPPDEQIHFYRLLKDRFVAAACDAHVYESAAVPGFRLSLPPVREAFRAFEG